MAEPTRLGLGPRLLLAIGIPIYRLWMATLRIRWVLDDETAARIERGEPILYALWHETILVTPWTHRRLGLVVMSSRHRDGEVMARILTRAGFRTVRGSSTRGGSTALRGMLDAAEAGHSLAITPDGPKGPRRRVQAGVVEIARRTGLPVVSAGVTFRPAKRLGSWDRMLLPWPRARGVIHLGPPVAIPEDADPGPELSALGERLDRLQETVEARFDELWREGTRRDPYRRR